MANVTSTSSVLYRPNHPDLVQTLPRLYAGGDDAPQAERVAILAAWLASDAAFCEQYLYPFALEICQQHKGKGVLLRGIVEFSNQCQGSCHYCGLFRHNQSLTRYSLNDDDILACIDKIYSAGLRTVVLQSGQLTLSDPEPLAQLIHRIRQIYTDLAITLSVGEHPEAYYQKWHQSGANRYLLKIETVHSDLYRRIHPGMSLENRLQCLDSLTKLGYQVGCGGIVGLPGQTVQSLAMDLIYFHRQQFGMTSISPLIPHPQTPLASARAGGLTLTLNMIALTRILCPETHIPATTAMGSLHGNDYRPLALKAGANVVMLNFTPLEVKKLYEIYPGKRCLNEAICVVGCIQKMTASVGRTVDFSVGHATGYEFNDPN